MSIASCVIDSREPTYIQSLTFGGVPTAVTALDAGDLLLACDDGALIAVERKTVEDLLGTMREDRLMPQMQRLRQESEWVYLVICGSLSGGNAGRTYANGKETGWSWWSIQGALLTVQELGISIVYVPSEIEYEQAIIRLGNRERGPVRVRPPREAVLVSEGETILASLPGVGPERAKALLDYCGSPAWALAYLTDDGWVGPNAAGIGSGIRTKVRLALGLEDWAILHPMSRDGKTTRLEGVA